MVLECLLYPILYRVRYVNQIDLFSKDEYFRLVSLIISQTETVLWMKIYLIKKIKCFAFILIVGISVLF